MAEVHSGLKPCSRHLTYRAVDEGLTVLAEKAKNYLIQNLLEDANEEMTNSTKRCQSR